MVLQQWREASGQQVSFVIEGEPFATARAVSIAAREGQILAAVRFEVSRLAPATDECTATFGTGRALCGLTRLPVGRITFEREICEHTRTQAIPALIQCLLNFA